MNERGGLPLNRLDDGWRAVPHRQCADAADEIDERVAVEVVHQGTFRPGSDDIRRPSQPAGHGGGAASQPLLAAGPGHRAHEANGTHDFSPPVIRCIARPHRPGHRGRRVEDDQHAVVVADRIVQIVLEQSPESKPDAALHRQGRIREPPRAQVLIILLGRHPMPHSAIPAEHAGRDLTTQAETPHQFLTRRVERQRQPPATVGRMHPEIGSVEPGAVRLV